MSVPFPVCLKIKDMDKNGFSPGFTIGLKREREERYAKILRITKEGQIDHGCRISIWFNTDMRDLLSNSRRFMLKN